MRESRAGLRKGSCTASSWVWVCGVGRGRLTEKETPEAPSRGRGDLLKAELGRAQTHLLLHPTLQQHRHTRLDGEGNLPAADQEVLLQGLPEGRFLHPGLCRGERSKRGVSERGQWRSPMWASSLPLLTQILLSLPKTRSPAESPFLGFWGMMGGVGGMEGQPM